MARHARTPAPVLPALRAPSSALLDADVTVARRTFDVRASVSLAAGERLALFGTSGAGKTTLVEAIAGTTPITSGEVRLNHKVVNAPVSSRRAGGSSIREGTRKGRPAPVPFRDRGVSVVRQPTTLFPHLNVVENVAFGLRHPATFRSGSLPELLEQVGLSGLERALPARLSGGQRQRAALARALARPFRALLLDEPFSAVDVTSRGALRQLAIDAACGSAAVSVLVTHDLSEAQAFGNRIGVMDSGRILQLGDADEIARAPADRRVAELFGYTTFVEHDELRLRAFHPDRFAAGSHPERGLVLQGVVTAVRASGARFSCELEVASPTNMAVHGPIRVNVDCPPSVGATWEVTAIEPPLVARVAVAGTEEG